MYSKQMRGMSFMDVIIGTALMLIIFTALIGLLRSSLQVSALAKTRGIANSIAESQIEYLRSLSYDNVGTVGGIPAGPVPQNTVSTQNGVNFPVRTFIDYADDPADGTGSGDTNGITTDYKEIKVSVTYTVGGRSQTISLISNYAPPGLETTTNGGTLKIQVVNAVGAGVPGASVRIVNSVVSPTIDLTTFSDAQGIVFLPGAPISTEYQITVSKTGYSSAQTYARDATNQNPAPGYLTVVKNVTTTGTFAIDLLTTLGIQTYSPIASSTFSDTFTTSANVANSANTIVTGGAVQLTNTAGVYAVSGTVRSIAQTPTYLAGWGTASSTIATPSGTSVRFHIVNGTGTLLPDTAVPGNATGFIGSVNLTGLSTSTYPSLALSADLTTSSTAVTPQLQDWGISYARGPIPLPNIAFSLLGSKTTGSTGAGLPLYKTNVSTSTNATGLNTVSLEWDAYALTLPSYDVVQACNAPPYTLSPGSTLASSLVLSTNTTNMMLVSVRASGAAVSGADVTLSSGAFSKTVTTDSCGSAYFGALTSGSYSITATKTGYTTFNATSVPVSGHVFYPLSFD